MIVSVRKAGYRTKSLKNLPMARGGGLMGATQIILCGVLI